MKISKNMMIVCLALSGHAVSLFGGMIGTGKGAVKGTPAKSGMSVDKIEDSLGNESNQGQNNEDDMSIDKVVPSGLTPHLNALSKSFDQYINMSNEANKTKLVDTVILLSDYLKSIIAQQESKPVKSEPDKAVLDRRLVAEAAGLVGQKALSTKANFDVVTQMPTPQWYERAKVLVSSASNPTVKYEIMQLLREGLQFKYDRSTPEGEAAYLKAVKHMAMNIIDFK